jgi:hypothetical protein
MLRRRGDGNGIEVNMVLPMKARPSAPDFHQVPRDVRNCIQKINIAGRTGDTVDLCYDKTAAAMKAHLLAESPVNISEERPPGRRRSLIGLHKVTVLPRA